MVRSEIFFPKLRVLFLPSPGILSEPPPNPGKRPKPGMRSEPPPPGDLEIGFKRLKG